LGEESRQKDCGEGEDSGNVSHISVHYAHFKVKAGPSLRRKNGYVQDDRFAFVVSHSWRDETAP
jgi:hypothetical protein